MGKSLFRLGSRFPDVSVLLYRQAARYFWSGHSLILHDHLSGYSRVRWQAPAKHGNSRYLFGFPGINQAMETLLSPSIHSLLSTLGGKLCLKEVKSSTA